MNAPRAALSRLLASDIVRKVAQTFSVEVFIFVLSFFLSIVVARSLGPEKKGLYALAGLVGALAVQFGNMGLHASNVYHVSKDRKLLAPLVGNTIAVSIFCGGGGAICLWVLFGSFPGISPVKGPLLWLVLLGVPFTLATQLLQGLLMGLQEVRTYNGINLAVKILLTAAILGVFLSGSASPEGFMAAVLAMTVLNAAWILKRLRRLAGAAFRPSAALFRESLRYGLKAYVSALLAMLVMRVDLLMVNHYLGAAETGLYSLATGIITILYLLPNTTGMVVFPKLCEMGSFQERWKLAVRVSLSLGVILAPALLVIVAAARPGIAFVYGEDFAGAAVPLLWLLPGFVIMALEGSFRRVIISETYRREIVMSWGAAFVLNILLNVLLIPRLGLKGAAIASNLSLAVVALVTTGLLLPKFFAHEGE